MHRTFDLLVNGDAAVLDHYKAAVQRWKEIWQRPQSNSMYALASLLSSEQTWFETNCGGRSLGQEIMVISGFAILYTPQDGSREEKQARMLFDAFQSSSCSVEVKFGAEWVASTYDLIDSTTY